MTIESLKNRDPKDILAIYGLPETRNNDLFSRQTVELYAPRDFKMSILIGNPDSEIAINTGWGDPWIAVPEDAIEKFAVLGSLRIPFGIDIMLHNLARNPQIRGLVVWARGKTDLTDIGTLPRKILKALWENGVTDDGQVIGGGYKLSPELVENGGLDTVRKILANVTFYDWSEVEREDLATLSSMIPKNGSSYMEPVVLPEFKVKEVDTFPSEKIGLIFREKDGFSAWLSLLNGIIKYGDNVLLETGGTAVRELRYVRVVIEGERPFDNIPEWALKLTNLSLNPEGLEDYYRKLFGKDPYTTEIFPGVKKFERPPNEKYLYAELLHAFPRPAEFDRAVVWLAEHAGIDTALEFLRAGRPVEETTREVMRSAELDDLEKVKILLEIYRPPVNQVAKAIERIKKTPDDADKTMILWDPATHGMQNSGRPCLIEVAMLVRNGKIDMSSKFRSHDIAKGWIFNAYGLWRLFEEICRETGYKPGTLTLESESAHIYKGDINWVSELRKEEILDKKPSRVFDHTKADPRGDISVTVIGEEIVCKLLDAGSGRPILEFSGKDHRDVMAFISHHGLISQPSHGLDMGTQLLAAEWAMKLGIPFTQDRPHEVFGELKRRLNG